MMAGHLEEVWVRFHGAAKFFSFRVTCIIFPFIFKRSTGAAQSINSSTVWTPWSDICAVKRPSKLRWRLHDSVSSWLSGMWRWEHWFVLPQIKFLSASDQTKSPFLLANFYLMGTRTFIAKIGRYGTPNLLIKPRKNHAVCTSKTTDGQAPRATASAHSPSSL